jgi:inhibitor of KinA
MVVYDPLVSSLSSLKSQIMDIWGTVDEAQLPSPRIVEIPVVYGDEFGPDLEWVAHYLKMTPEEVIRLHTQPTYQVYMIGFMPGYPYMGEVVDSLVTPRVGKRREPMLCKARLESPKNKLEFIR